ncbi:hypothetical protein ACEN2S_22250 [Phaeovulum sp. W22_SRMD_FR3]
MREAGIDRESRKQYEHLVLVKMHGWLPKVLGAREWQLTQDRASKPKVWSVRISGIRPRILLRQAMSGRFGAAAPQRRHALDRQ